MRDLEFHGTLFRSMVKLLPTPGAVVNLTEWVSKLFDVICWAWKVGKYTASS